MIVLKKLCFAPLFLIIYICLIYTLTPLLKSYDFIFSLSLSTLISLIIISALIVGVSFSFILFSLSLDWRIILPVIILTSLTPFIFVDLSLGLVLFVGSVIGLMISFISLENMMKSYLTFQPNSILGPPIRQLSALLILVFCIGYFLSMSKVVSEKGFSIPDSLIETALKFSGQESADSVGPALPSISQQQIDLLKKNPDLLKQSGLDPKILDTLNSPKTPNNQNDLIKQTVKDQVQGFLKPYLGFVPVLLAVLLFLTLQSLTSILNLLIYPLLWVIFYILEKTGFIKFTEEMRPVKKMVV